MIHPAIIERMRDLLRKEREQLKEEARRLPLSRPPVCIQRSHAQPIDLPMPLLGAVCFTLD